MIVLAMSLISGIPDGHNPGLNIEDYIKVISILLEHGPIEIDVKDHNGVTPIQMMSALAKIRYFQESQSSFIELLEQTMKLPIEEEKSYEEVEVSGDL